MFEKLDAFTSKLKPWPFFGRCRLPYGVFRFDEKTGRLWEQFFDGAFYDDHDDADVFERRHRAISISYKKIAKNQDNGEGDITACFSPFHRVQPRSQDA